MKVAFVANRYGEQIVGGAEAATRSIAERVASQLGWQVEALSTCASGYRTWENDLPAGESWLNGVLLRRFPSVHKRGFEFDLMWERMAASPGKVGAQAAERWVELQGPRCPELVEALAASDADVVSFAPYLYYPTVRGIQVTGRRSILQPCAHDEPPIYLPVFRDTFESAAGFVYNTSWERSFVEGMFEVGSVPSLTMGLGVEDPAGDVPPVAAIAEGIGERPFVCCLGRVEGGKGTDVLAELFAGFKRRHPGPLALVMVGPVVAAPPEHPDLIVLGQVDEATKWSILDASLALISPSPFESFSLVLFEAWSRRRPAMVNAFCAATRGESERSGAGIPFSSFSEFEVALERLVSDASLRAQLGERGHAYVDANFRWPALIERWGHFAEQVADRAA